MMLLERTSELAALRQRLSAAAAGQGHTVLVSGEAGIGKSALIRAFLADPGVPARILRGACEDLQIAEPLAPLYDLARQADWSLPASMADSGGRMAVFSRALGVLDSASGPTILVIEDLHWADDATVDFLRYVGRRIEAAHILLILTSRDDETLARNHIRRVTTAIPSDSLTRLRLGPLTMDAIAAMAKSSGRDAGELLRLTGGNAFFVTEALRASAGERPASVQDFVLERAATLGSSARQVLETVSIMPRRAEADLVSRLAGGDDGIAACLDSGLLEHDGDHLAFRHELARQAVESSLSESRRLSLNRAALKALEDQGGSSFSRLLHHAAASRDSAAILRFAPQAATEAENSGSLRQARDFLKLAADNAAGLSDAEKAALLQRLAFASVQIGDSAAALASQTAALNLFRIVGDVVAEGGSYRRLSRISWIGGQRADANRFARLAISTLQDHRVPELAMALSNMAQLDMLDYQFEKVEEYCRQAISIAEESDRPDIISHAKNNLGTALTHSDPDQGRVLLEESLQISLASDLTDDAARAHTNIACFEYDVMNFEACLKRALTGLDYSRALEQEGFYRYQAGIAGWAFLHLGRWHEAGLLAEEGRQLMEQGGNASQSFPAACTHVWLALRRGQEPDPAVVSYLDEFIATMDETQCLEVYAAIEAEKAWLQQSDPSRALRLLEAVFESTKDFETIPYAFYWLAKLGGQLNRPLPNLLAAPVRLSLGNDWQQAAEAWAATGSLYYQALALAEGDAAARARSVELLSAMGAEAVLRKLAADWRAQGFKTEVRIPRASAHEHASGLTTRQVDVLRALSEGLSNAEIARKLFISPKTVDHHISAILAVLEAGSRGEAAAKARQKGWV